MTWLDLANLLFDQSKSLSPRGAHLHLDTAGWVRTWTPHQNQEADRAVRHFAIHLDWPPVEEEVASQLYFRCLFAIEKCIGQPGRTRRNLPAHGTDQSMLEALPIQAWHLEALEWAGRRYATGGAKPIYA